MYVKVQRNFAKYVCDMYVVYLYAITYLTYVAIQLGK